MMVDFWKNPPPILNNTVSTVDHFWFLETTISQNLRRQQLSTKMLFCCAKTNNRTYLGIVRKRGRETHWEKTLRFREQCGACGGAHIPLPLATFCWFHLRFA
ncbi:hypothetical protein AMECASPLE_039714 [Ameca splendens]|uniref:Uncharacterized protein n=1 Tax=Ameca splendens TaxID=208324 RepID=A0ABV0ZVJ8_9TELE